MATSSTASGGRPQRERKAKITPLPLSQMIPMTIVIMNESICGTMLMPFVGIFVAFLQKIPVNEAGYYSGVLIGVFMLGQVVSAKMWGRISDKYGRRFPIISGLFTSGLMMMGFGLSTNVWMCAVFRFLQGLFNGNVLVAKTMMADITDKTNQAGGFSFMSLCTAFGFLIGPGLGGLLYDPVNSTTLSWVGFDKTGFFATHPAFLTSLVVFIYTNIGMLVCTFLVKESNPKAQPLPGFVRLVYPCLWYKSEPFVLPPIEYEDEEEEEVAMVNLSESSEGDKRAAKGLDTSSQENTEHAFQQAREGREPGGGLSWPREVARTASDTTGLSPQVSPVENSEGVQRDFCAAEGGAVVNGKMPGKAMSPYNKASFTSPVKQLEDTSEEEGDVANERVVLVELKRGRNEEREGEVAHALSTRRGDEDEATEVHLEEEEVKTVFGYREAFALPSTRFMLSQYMVLSATDMMARDCFPLWAVAKAANGGLGLTSEQLGYILLANSAPCLMANLLFRVVERYFTNRMGLMRVGVGAAGTVVLLLPFNSYLGAHMYTYILVFLCTAGRQVFVSWCYSLNTMLTARSAPPGHVGSIMGINQSCGALVRGIVPFVAAPLFAWSISGDHIIPFNHVLVFFISSMAFYWCWWRSYRIRTDGDCNLQMVP